MSSTFRTTRCLHSFQTTIQSPALITPDSTNLLYQTMNVRKNLAELNVTVHAAAQSVGTTSHVPSRGLVLISLWQAPEFEDSVENPVILRLSLHLCTHVKSVNIG
jgi:hypothetical protein